MTENELEGRNKLRDFMKSLLDQTGITEAEKEHCIEECPGYLRQVVYKYMKMDGTTDEGGCLRAAILGFIGGYASRNLYDLKPKNENN